MERHLKVAVIGAGGSDASARGISEKVLSDKAIPMLH